MDVLPCDLILANRGDSAMRIRMAMDTPTKRMDTQNGMRQPQSLKRTSPTRLLTLMMTANVTNSPRGAVTCIQLVQKPRAFLGACSAT